MVYRKINFINLAPKHIKYYLIKQKLMMYLIKLYQNKMDKYIIKKNKNKNYIKVY